MDDILRALVPSVQELHTTLQDIVTMVMWTLGIGSGVLWEVIVGRGTRCTRSYHHRQDTSFWMNTDVGVRAWC